MPHSFLRSHQSGTTELGRIPIDSDTWTTPLPGIRVLGTHELSHRLLAESAVRLSERPAIACDLTAAYLWSVVVPSGFGLEIDAQACGIATLRGGSRHRASGIRGRRLDLPPEHITSVDGIRISTPARTWIDCAALISPLDVVAMGDAILRARLASLTELQRMVIWGRGRRGIRAARQSLPILDPAAESPAESWVRARLIYSGVDRPTCNVEVTVEGWRFRLDMAWIPARVAVEYDGQQHHGPEMAEHDAWRRALLRRDGWTVIVVTRDDFASFDRVVSLVQEALRSRPAHDHSRAH